VGTSDKEESKRQEPVRSCGYFGQGRVQKARACPKLWVLRTRKSPKRQEPVRSQGNFGQGRVQKGKSLSEVRGTSDKEESKRAEPVRSQGDFGHGGVQKGRACPKTGGLRTRKSPKGQSLSEVRGTSDMEESKKQEPVRSQMNFGQGRVQKARACPKPWVLRTRKSQKGKSRYEVRGTSDKEEPKKARACPKQWELRTMEEPKRQEPVRSRETLDRVMLKRCIYVG